MDAAKEHQLPTGEDATGNWSITARNDVNVQVLWRAEHKGRSVSGRVRDQDTQESHAFVLDLAHQDQDTVALKLETIEVTLTLQRKGRHVTLICNLPLSGNKFFNGTIGEWHVRHGHHDEVDVVEPAIVNAPHEAMDLAPFVWMHPLTSREQRDSVLRFVVLDDPATLPLYQTLAALTTPTDKQHAASTFIGGSDFVSALNKLPAPVCNFPAFRMQLLELVGTQSLAQLTKLAEQFLDESIAKFLVSTEWQTASDDCWQSLFALALSGTAQDGTLADKLVDVLRVGHFLTLLDADTPALTAAHERRIVLFGTVVFPDAVATYDLSPMTVSDSGSWEVLGVGSVQRARQKLMGYRPGELADVVNVMPMERQERQEHRVTQSETQTRDNQSQRQDQEQSRQVSSLNELSDAFQEVMAAEGIVRNLSDVKPSYQSLNEILTGSGSGGNGDAGWAGQDISRLVQQLSEKAVHHLGDSVSHQRGHVWKELTERRQSNLIDNTSNQRLVGVYRWIDKLMQIRLDNAGPHLVFGFLINQPALAWVNSLISLGEIPLQKPEPLAAFKVPNGQGYIDILPTNYQSFAAQYGLRDLPPPPPDTLTIATTVNRVVVGDASELCVPEGYVAATGAVTIALGDNQYNVVCSIAGQDVSYPGTPATPPALTVIAPVASSSTTVGNAVINPPVKAVSVLETVALSQIKGSTGPLALTVLSSAPMLGVTVTINCTRGLASGDDPLLVNWQMQCYEQLKRGWEQALKHYYEELARRIELASRGHMTELQRQVLSQSCLQELAPVADNPRSLLTAFDWCDMTWHYDAWPVGTTNPWPRVIASMAQDTQGRRQFARFLEAPCANVLLPVKSGFEAWLLFQIQYRAPWLGSPETTPITDSTLTLMEEIVGPNKLDRDRVTPHWTIKLPTSLLYLQQGEALPHEAASLLTQSPVACEGMTE